MIKSCFYAIKCDWDEDMFLCGTGDGFTHINWCEKWGYRRDAMHELKHNSFLVGRKCKIVKAFVTYELQGDVK